MSEGDRVHRDFLAGVTQTVGVLMAMLCGLCTVVSIVSSGSEPAVALFALVLGGVPTAAGLLMIWAGGEIRRMNRRGPGGPPASFGGREPPP